MDSCIFCKINAREIPGHIVYENEDVLAFLDIAQATKGHTLVIPKKHITDIFEMDAETAAGIFKVVPQIANALKNAFGAEGMNIENNNRSIAGQEVFHHHIHLIPRYSEDDDFKLFAFPNNYGKYSQDELAQLKDKIKEHV
ncbi:MAG: HIT family protein [Turicibacter sp.]|nr:HIT family protein [Turicibacter sp.]